MEPKGHEVHIAENDARAGSTPGIVRYVLLISLVLAIAALTIVWVTGAFNANQDNNGTDDSHRALVQQQQREAEKSAK